MHVDVDISNIADHVNLGGIDQPVIGQRHVIHDVRLHEGEVNLLAGLIQQEDTKTVTGIPGLSSIPLLRRLFTGESVTHKRDELMIALIPHVIRRTEITPENLKGIAVGNATTIKLNYGQPKPDEVAAPKGPGAGVQGPGAGTQGPGAGGQGPGRGGVEGSSEAALRNKANLGRGALNPRGLRRWAEGSRRVWRGPRR